MVVIAIAVLCATAARAISNAELEGIARTPGAFGAAGGTHTALVRAGDGRATTASLYGLATTKLLAPIVWKGSAPAGSFIFGGYNDQLAVELLDLRLMTRAITYELCAQSLQMFDIITCETNLVT